MRNFLSIALLGLAVSAVHAGTIETDADGNIVAAVPSGNKVSLQHNIVWDEIDTPPWACSSPFFTTSHRTLSSYPPLLLSLISIIHYDRQNND